MIKEKALEKRSYDPLIRYRRLDILHGEITGM